ncbi:MAG: Mov34/MPN/PAD-1 family protein, partial [Planctomycetaceae bacterium]|nr:Mov34/MPN/PAD-1 family protein [Planctomycetaceae bacterium]
MNNSPCDESRHSAEYLEHWATQSLGQDDADVSSNHKQTGSLRMISSTAEEAVAVALDLDSSRFLRRVATQKELLRAGDPQVAMTQTAYRQVMDHLTADTTREYGGLLYGQRIKAADGTYVGVLVLHAEPAAFSPGNSHRMSFTQETWLAYERMEDQWREAGIQWERLGWYHSHPDFSIFLSNHDLDVCSLFRHPTHVALVVDPCRLEGGFFVRGMEGFRP